MISRRAEQSLRKTSRPWRPAIAIAALAALVAGCADVPAQQAVRVDSAASTRKLAALPRKPGELTPVSIY